MIFPSASTFAVSQASLYAAMIDMMLVQRAKLLNSSSSKSPEKHPRIFEHNRRHTVLYVRVFTIRQAEDGMSAKI
jgi:hypothetical protein